MATPGFTNDDVVAKFLTTKLHTWRGRYQRVFCLTKTGMVNIDPSSWTTTNSWPFEDFVDAFISTDKEEEPQFTLKVNIKGKSKSMRFICSAVSELLGTLFDLYYKFVGKVPDDTFPCKKSTRAGKQVDADCLLAPSGLEVDSQALKKYKYNYWNISKVLEVDDDPYSVLFFVFGRARLLSIPDRENFLYKLGLACARIGLKNPHTQEKWSIDEFRKHRMLFGNDDSPAMEEFILSKITKAHPEGVDRKMLLTEAAIVEKDAETYGTTGVYALHDIFSFVRHWEDPQTLSIEYRDGRLNTFTSGDREEILSCLLDATRAAGNRLVFVCAEPSRRGMQVLPLSLLPCIGADILVVKHLFTAAKNVPSKLEGVYEKEFLDAIKDFNSNCVGILTADSVKKAFVEKIVLQLIQHIASIGRVKDAPSTLMLSTARCLHILCQCSVGFALIPSLPGIIPALETILSSPDAGVCYRGVEILHTLCQHDVPGESRNIPQETLNKQLLMVPPTMRALVALLDRFGTTVGASTAGSKHGTLVLLAVVRYFESTLCQHSDTTIRQVHTNLLSCVATRYGVMLSLFRSRCAGIMECTALIIQVIVEKASGKTARMVQQAALNEGILLRHLFMALFAPSVEQRFLSRYLTGLWVSLHAPALALFKRLFPSGLLHYLEMPPLTDQELDNLEAVELMDLDQLEADGGATAGGVASGRASWRRLRKRLKQGAGNSRSSGSSGTSGLLSTRENFSVFFHMATQDHTLPDLLWNASTRGELRSALDAELRAFEHQQMLHAGSSRTRTVKKRVVKKKKATPADGHRHTMAATARRRSLPKQGVADEDWAIISESADVKAIGRQTISGGSRVRSSSVENMEALLEQGRVEEVEEAIRVVWNFLEFNIVYKCLKQELSVDGWYIRLLLEASDNAVREIPQTPVFFRALYYRLLRERALDRQVMCIQAMTKVYSVHSGSIGVFEDIPHLVSLMSDARHFKIRDNLLLLLVALSADENNCEALLNEPTVKLLVDILAMSHTQPLARRVTEVAHASAIRSNVKLLTDGPSEADRPAPPPPPPEPEDGSQETKSSSRSERLGWGDMPVWFYLVGESTGGKGKKEGPVTIYQLRTLLQNNTVTPKTLVWANSMPEWMRLSSVRQLQWALLCMGEVVLTPAQAAQNALTILGRLVMLHSSVDETGAELRPIPLAKRILSSEACLAHVAQSLLSGVPEIVEGSTRLLRLLVEHNPQTLGALFRTGLFYFVLVYAGSNWTELSHLLYETHLMQNFQTASSAMTGDIRIGARSILGESLPESLLCWLTNNGPEKFSQVFLGDTDNPEVIWKHSMRGHLVEMVKQHLGSFPERLRAQPSAKYEYCPIPPIHYSALDEELWCHNFYLANLCDSVRFPDWPIPEPVPLLRAVLDAWRDEYTKEAPEVSLTEAAETMGLADSEGPPDPAVIRKAYKKLAMKYHPDKNPKGRDMFEKIQAAYELLTTARPQAVCEPDIVNISLVVRTQVVLYERFQSVLKPYKFAGYPLLLEVLKPPAGRIDTDKFLATVLLSSANLLYLTCLASPLNADEFSRENGVSESSKLLAACVRDIKSAPRAPPTATGADEDDVMRDEEKRASKAKSTEEVLEADHYALAVCKSLLNTFSGLAAMKVSRDAMVSLPLFVRDVVWTLALQPRSPQATRQALWILIRMSELQPLQKTMVAEGAIWPLLLLMFIYDSTVSVVNIEEGEEESSDTSNMQSAFNTNAQLAARAIGRLSGCLYGNLATEPQEPVILALSRLFTPHAFKLLRRARPKGFLETITGHVETPVLLWTGQMRQAVVQFSRTRAKTGGEADGGLAKVEEFKHQNLDDELIIGDIYTRIYIEQPAFTLDDPVGYGEALFDFVFEQSRRVANDRTLKQLKMALHALHLLMMNNPDSIVHLSTAHHMWILLTLSRSVRDSSPFPAGKDDAIAPSPLPAASPLRSCAIQVLMDMATTAACAEAMVEGRYLPILLRLSQYGDVAGGEGKLDDKTSILQLLRKLCAHQEFVGEMLTVGAMVDLLALVAGVIIDTTSAPQLDLSEAVASIRLPAADILAMLCSDRMFGSRVMTVMLRLMPAYLGHCLRVDGGAALEKVYDSDFENAELIWKTEMRKEFALAIWELQKQAREKRLQEGFVWDLDDGYSIQYRCLAKELVIGGVFVRLFLKEPKFNLHNPKGFLEACWKRFLSEGEAMCRMLEGSGATDAPTSSGDGGDGALVVSEESVLTRATHCLVCLLRVRPILAEHTAALGYVDKLSSLLRRAVTQTALGAAAIACVRLIHQLADNKMAVQGIARVRPAAIGTLVRSLDPLHKDAAFSLECIKKLLTKNIGGQLFSDALDSGILPLLLGILDKDVEALSALVDPSATKVFAVDIIKLLERDPQYGAFTRSKLVEDPVWERYRHQKHDLFLARNERATGDYLLLEAVKEEHHMLEDGSA